MDQWAGGGDQQPLESIHNKGLLLRGHGAAQTTSHDLYYNHHRKLKSLKYHAPFDILINEFEFNSFNFRKDPRHIFMGLKK
jgi:hypothetical protein